MGAGRGPVGLTPDVRQTIQIIERQGQEAASGFQFLEFLPRDKSKSDTVVIYLHGTGERGNNLSWVKRYGLPALLARSEASVNCRVLCPQLETGAIWEADRTAQFIGATTQSTRKIALIGYSLGASGVCDVVGLHGPLVNVAVGIAGQAPKGVKTDQSGTKFLAIQGELDPWPCTDDFVHAVNASGGVAQNITLQGRDHCISEEALFHPAFTAILQSAGIEIAKHGSYVS